MVQEKPFGKFVAPVAFDIYRNQTLTSASRDAQSSATLPAVTAVEKKLLIVLSEIYLKLKSLPTFNTSLQEVKTLLYDKDYEKAFGGKEEHRQVYAARWVPARAVIYRKLFKENLKEIKTALMRDGVQTKEIVFIGGGAGSEAIAMCSILERINVNEWENIGLIKLTVVDSSDWKELLANLKAAMMRSWPILEKRVAFEFVQTNVLGQSSMVDYSIASLITILFTISELYLQSKTKTLSLLARITSAVKAGTLLLIVESASLAEISVGKSGRTHSLGTLMDHVLSQDVSRDIEGRAKWENLTTEDSIWYRMPLGAQECYPLKLENSRVLIRLYRRKE